MRIDNGSAIGVISSAGAIDGEPFFRGGPNPVLVRNLPAWLVRKLGASNDIDDAYRRSSRDKKAAPKKIRPR